MNAQEAKSILTIALMAAFADGLKDERERATVESSCSHHEAKPRCVAQ